MQVRHLLRLLIVWAIGLPLFYLFILPPLMERLNEKARTENTHACVAQLTQPAIPAATVEKYCHCVMGGLTFTRGDLFDIARQRPPVGLRKQVEAASETCSVIVKAGS